MAETVKIPLAIDHKMADQSTRTWIQSWLFAFGLTVNLERDLDLGLPTRSGRNVGQVKLAELVVVLGHRSFTLVNLDGNGRLVVDGSGEDLRLLGGHHGVPGAVGSSRDT